MMSFAAQASAVSAVILLLDYLFGIFLGVVGSAVFASVRENRRMSLLQQAPDPVSAGARVILGVFTRDDGYLASLPPDRRRSAGHPHRVDPSGSHGQELDR